VVEVSWSRWEGQDCIRLAGLEPEADVRIRPATAVGFGGLPPMAGRLVRDGGDMCFLPRFAFLGGTTYTVTVDDVVAADLVRREPERAATTEVLAIYPTAKVVPRNLLRLYVWFSAPMSEGYAAEHVRLIDDVGTPMVAALLPTEYELWDAGRRRLTVLLDPARIKRGLVGHRQVGYPLRPGVSFRLVVGDGFRDARGTPLRGPAERRYEVGDDQRGHVQPQGWDVLVPSRHTVQPLRVGFERPLDHGLLGRCLHVVDPAGRIVDGTAEIGPEERSWRLAPRRAWAPGPHQLVVDPVLEDSAGNSVRRVFDRDLASGADEPQRDRPVTLTFHPS
jgi:hypothetical protein